MGLVFLTQQGGILLPFAWVMGIILNGIFEMMSLLNIYNIAVCIVIFTIVTKMLMLPLTIKQQKFSKLSAKMNPDLTKIQAKYKDKKDEASKRNQQLEMQEVYDKYGTNPMGGCLPLLISLPIMFALYRVIYKVPAYVDDIYVMYNGIVTVIQNISTSIGADSILPEAMNNFVKAFSIKSTVSLSGTAWSLDFVKKFIDILAQFNKANWEAFLGGNLVTSDSWNALMTATSNTADTWIPYLTKVLGTDYITDIASMKDITELATLLNLPDLGSAVKLSELSGSIYWNTFSLAADLKNTFANTAVTASTTVTSTVDQIIHINSFVGGMNILDASGWKFPGILIPIFAAGTQFIQGKLMKTTTDTTNTQPDSPVAQSMKGVTTFMPIMSGVMCVMMPIGVGIYWIASTVVQIVQQLFINRYMDHADVDAMIAKNVAKSNKRKEKLGVITSNSQMSNLAKKTTKAIDANSVKTEYVVKDEPKVSTKQKPSSEVQNFNKNTTVTKSSSISDIANMMKDRNTDKNQKKKTAEQMDAKTEDQNKGDGNNG